MRGRAREAIHARKRLVLAGVPGAGEAALLDLTRRSVREHFAVLEEAAGIVFGGDLSRAPTAGSRRAVQRRGETCRV